MQPIADCECCGKSLHEGDDFDFIAEGIVWVCRAYVEAEEDRLREEFGWIGVWRGNAADKGDRDARPLVSQDHERTSSRSNWDHPAQIP